MSTTSTRALAAFAARTRWDELPTRVRETTALILLDGLGCAVAGRDTPSGAAAIAFAASLGPGSAPIVGQAAGSNLLGATLVNGLLTYMLDFEPVGPDGHVCAATIPAALTLGAVLGRSGQQALQALAIGLEVGGRVGVGVRRNRQYLQQGQAIRGNNHAIFGAAAAAGYLLGLDEERMAHAFGIAGYSAPPPSLTRCMAAPPVRTIKYDNLGIAAQLGVQAALLAASGVTGDPDIIDGDTGFWRFTGAPMCDWEAMLDGLGREWIVPQTWFKPYPNSLYAAPAVDVTRQIVDREALQPDQVDRVTVYTRQTTAVGRDPRPETSSSAGLSLPMNLACVLAGIQPRRAWHASEVYRRPDLRALAARVEFAPLPADPSPPRPPWEGWAPVRVEIAAGGRTFSGASEGLRQLGPDEVVAKFEENVAGLVPASSARAVVEQVAQIDRLRSFGDLLRPLEASPA